MANIRQVAKKAGVSPATVSRVLSGDPDFNVREETRRKINDAVAALQYEIPVREQNQYRFGCVLSHTTDKYSDHFTGSHDCAQNTYSAHHLHRQG